jgi:hypothetical protein
VAQNPSTLDPDNANGLVNIDPILIVGFIGELE